MRNIIGADFPGAKGANAPTDKSSADASHAEELDP